MVNCTGLNFGGKWKMSWANSDLELDLDNSLLSLDDLVTPPSIKTLRIDNRKLTHIKPSGN